jgi:phosphoketolase
MLEARRSARTYLGRKLHDRRPAARPPTVVQPGSAPLPALDAEETRAIDAWWRANNYLTVGQIYLRANPLLREPLASEHIKPRLLGHWGTSPGLSFVYAHVSRLIRHTGQQSIYLAGPGHGGPALVAAGWLEGTYSEVYPAVSQDAPGMQRLFRQFSTPGGIPSHVSVPTPGSIHEGGELGYVLVHAFGAVMDNPDLMAVAVVGDGEAETGPLEGSWKGISFLNPAHDGAVLPVLHLNGAKISGPTVLARKDPAEVRALFEGTATTCSRSRATTCRACTCASPPRWPRPGRPSAASRPTRDQAGIRRDGRAGRSSCCAARRAGPARSTSTGCG